MLLLYIWWDDWLIFMIFRDKLTATAAIGIHPTKAWLSPLVNFKTAIWTWGHLEERYAIKFCFKLGKMPQKRMECFTLLLEHLVWTKHQFLSGIRDSRKAGNLWGMMRSVRGVRKSIDQSWLAKGLGLLCWSFKSVQELFPSEGASTLQIGSVAFLPGQCNSSQLYPCHRWVLKQFLILLIVKTLLPVTFGYSLSSEAVVMRQLRWWKRLWGRSLKRSHKRTSMGPSRSCWNGRTSALQPEEITSKGTWVSCVYYQ